MKPTEITSVQLTEMLAVLMDIRDHLCSGKNQEARAYEAALPKPGLKHSKPTVKSISAYDPNEECPDCGAPMKPRTGKHGVFLGCLNYPECKGTRQI